MIRGAPPRAARAAAFLVAASLLAAGPAAAQPLPAHDPDQPIEVLADTLEVRQNEQVAVFTGNVDAIQGGLHLRAQTLRVHYDEKARAADDQAAAGTQPAAAISRIEADGQVFVSSRTETAQGDSGIYDVRAGVITLTGAVVLTRGENVLRGQRLVLDLSTGQSTIEGSGAARDGRVRGLFVPPPRQAR